MRTTIMLFLAAIFTSPVSGQQDLDTSAFNKEIRVQDDLFQHVNGTWLNETEIPADKSNYGSFIRLADLSQKRIKELIQELAESEHAKGSDEQMVADFYRSFMNTEAIEAAGLNPLKAELAKIDGLKTSEDVFQHFGYLQSVGGGAPAGFFVSQDAKDSSRYICQLIQSGITLPDRDYYLKDDEKSTAARAAMSEYITKLYELCGWGDAGDAVKEILDLETALAKIQIPRVELRDAEKRYNPFELDQLKGVNPNLNWGKFFAALNLNQEVVDVNVNTPAFFDGLNGLMKTVDVETWKKYMKFQLVDSYAPILNEALSTAHFDLHSRAIGGVEEQLPRWKRAVNTVAGGRGFGSLGDVVGRLYVAKHFPPEAKTAMDELVGNLLKSFSSSIDDLAWMTDATKKRAQEKLGKITTKIGYTKKWRDYNGLDVVADDLFANVVSSGKVEYKRMIDRLGKPVDREQWGMTPQTVNAYYNPALNEIVFPAAILQSPFFSKDAEPALNYGGIGAVIGHEISHAFDDQGSKYDGDGNLNNWWSDEDRDAFKKLTTQLVAQYEAYSPLEGKNVNGNLTLGENIADLSGLSIAHRAYQLSLGGSVPEKVAGWTGDQLFFVGWSRVWRRKYRDADMVRRLLTDPHSPSQYRANGPVSNIDAFYKAFDLKEGDALYKPKGERLQIW